MGRPAIHKVEAGMSMRGRPRAGHQSQTSLVSSTSSYISITRLPPWFLTCSPKHRADLGFLSATLGAIALACLLIHFLIYGPVLSWEEPYEWPGYLPNMMPFFGFFLALGLIFIFGQLGPVLIGSHEYDDDEGESKEE